MGARSTDSARVMKFTKELKGLTVILGIIIYIFSATGFFLILLKLGFSEELVLMDENETVASGIVLSS